MTLPVHRALAIIAGVLAVMAIGAGSPYRSQASLTRIAADAESGAGRIGAVDLARRIHGQQALTLIDVRSIEDHNAYRLPTAKHVPLARLASVAIDGRTHIVVYGNSDAQAATAWTLLRARGVRTVSYLAGGVDAWIVHVMEPMLADGAGVEEEAVFEDVAALSRYFGGTPRRGMNPAIVAERLARIGASASASRTPDAIAGREEALRRVRRGCGF